MAGAHGARLRQHPGQQGRREDRFVQEHRWRTDVQNRELTWLLCWMVELLLFGAARDEFGRCDVPHGGVLARFSKPRGALLSDVPTRFMLKPIVHSRENGSAFVPDDLLMM